MTLRQLNINILCYYNVILFTTTPTFRFFDGKALLFRGVLVLFYKCIHVGAIKNLDTISG